MLWVFAAEGAAPPRLAPDGAAGVAGADFVTVDFGFALAVAFPLSGTAFLSAAVVAERSPRNGIGLAGPSVLRGAGSGPADSSASACVMRAADCASASWPGTRSAPVTVESRHA